ncbi:MAG TPA: hypothetical protein VFX59_29740 [Polyangiales bacterium]|nr:hypothetical protein [Polyangiales bacterium]
MTLENLGIVLPPGTAFVDVLRALMERAIAEFPESFADFALPPDAAGFKAHWGELLPTFEASRARSEQRAEIARALYLAVAGELRYLDSEGERTLTGHLLERHEPFPLQRVDLPGPGQLRPSVDYAGRVCAGEELARLADDLEREHFATPAVASALADLVKRKSVSLRGERFVLFGAAAELSPVYTLLEAGADVLWLDRARPPIDHLLEPQLSGSLSFVDGGIDLLAVPGRARATIEAFADGTPVHLVMLASAHGAVMQLSVAMNEIARSLPPKLVKALHFLLSPTSVSPIYPDDAQCAEDRQLSASAVRRALVRTGQLMPGSVESGSDRFSCAVVVQQGAGHQLAEYVCKRLAAEAFFEFGLGLEAGKKPRGAGTVGVFANMVPVTNTRSLASPVLEAALLGAPSFDMLVATPSTARRIGALLMVSDVLAPRRAPATSSRRVRLAALFARQFHGGVHAQPYALDGIIRVAALKGLAQRPSLAFELLR